MSKKGKAKPSLGPVHIDIIVEDCFFECPFYDGDEAESICERGARNLPIYDRVNKKCIPPADCPFRLEADHDE